MRRPFVSVMSIRPSSASHEGCPADAGDPPSITKGTKRGGSGNLNSRDKWIFRV